MTAVAAALLYALFVWWFATGLVMLLVLRAPRWVNVAAAALLFVGALAVLAQSGAQTSASAAYVAFSAAIALWGAQEIAFLAGVITGPRPKSCPPGVRGLDRFGYAVSAILYHELALVVSGLAVFLVTRGAPNQIGALTFLVLWGMRISAKLNLFLGVPVLNDEMLPGRIAFLRTYFRRAPANPLFPVTVGLSILVLGWLVMSVMNPEASQGQFTGLMLVAALMGLAIIEHAFMLVPLPIDRLWAWSSRRAQAAAKPEPDVATGDLSRDLDRVAITSP